MSYRVAEQKGTPELEAVSIGTGGDLGQEYEMFELRRDGRAIACNLYKDDAALIVRAVNAHDGLVEALTELEAALRKDSRDKSILSDTVEYYLDGQAMYHVINKARAALSSLKEPS